MKNNPQNFRKTFGKLFHFMKPYQNKLFLAVTLTIFASFFNSLAPFILGHTTDLMIELAKGGTSFQGDIHRFWRTLILLTICYLLYAGLKFISSKLLVELSQQTIFDLRKHVDHKLKKLSLHYFDANPYGDILSRITNDIDMISNSLQQSLDQFATSITAILCILAMMLWISPLLTLIGIITVPTSMFVSMVIMRSSQKYFKEQQEKLGDLNGYVEEIYTGHDIIRAFERQQKSTEIFDRKNSDLSQSTWKAQFMSSTLMPVSQGISNLGYAVVIIVSGWLVIHGRMSIGMIQSFIQYLMQFSQPIIQSVQIAGTLQSAIASAERVFEFLDEEEEIPDISQSKTANFKDLTVELKQVRFGYTIDNPLMKEVNLKIEAGQKVAIVGPTGAGKTTLVNLLLRFYDIQNGSIEIGGVDIREMKRTALREIFGMVLQDTWLFTGSIMENIRYGNLDSSDEEVIAAAQSARADSFILALPGGYDFKLQENAANLAQGERQLLTIARAILSNRPIMIFDEATSSVDTRTEVLIQEAMTTLMQGRTNFIIAHRLSTIRNADIILYMEEGSIKESGSHKQLMACGGLYAQLYNSQFLQENEASQYLS